MYHFKASRSFFHAQAVLIQHGDVVLGNGVALLRQRFEQFEGSKVVAAFARLCRLLQHGFAFGSGAGCLGGTRCRQGCAD
uniref:Uncharacterized protein n=1 Tax=Conchiformibius kuhniae TaxID=211502 RepID=A0A8T9MXR6_9NEIS|nr:hypothetical protein LVJ77_01280 [Conchiformibius kuhniae]